MSSPENVPNFEGPLVYRRIVGEDSACTEDLKLATSALLVIADTPSQTNFNSEKTIYCIMPAHVLFTDERDKGAEADKSPWGKEVGATIRTIREKVSQHLKGCMHWVQLETTNDTKIDLRQSAMFCYRHWSYQSDRGIPCPEGKCMMQYGQTCHHMFMNDVAILPLRYQDDVELFKLFPKPVSIAELGTQLFEIKDVDHLKSLHNQRRPVKVQGFNGNLILRHLKNGQGIRYGANITFSLDAKYELYYIILYEWF